MNSCTLIPYSSVHCAEDGETPVRGPSVPSTGVLGW